MLFGKEKLKSVFHFLLSVGPQLLHAFHSYATNNTSKQDFYLQKLFRAVIVMMTPSWTSLHTWKNVTEITFNFKLYLILEECLWNNLLV